MRKFIATISIFTLLLLSFGCSSQKDIIEGKGNYYIHDVVEVFNDTIMQAQLDSVIMVDKLPVINEWLLINTKDYESGVSQPSFTVTNNNIIYTVKYIRDEKKYILMKREIKYSDSLK